MRTILARQVAAPILACGLALSLAACGSGREYTVPDKACGVPLNEKTLNPFLVDGENFAVKGGSIIDTGTKSYGHCTLSVDGWLVLDLQVDKVDKIYDPMAPLDEFRFKNREKLKDLPFPGLGAVGDFNSMVSTTCSAPAADYIVVNAKVSLQSDGDVAKRRKDIESFTLDFVPKVKDALQCTA
ncbi:MULTISPECIES: hypothetical protein [unclassified Streptomyces]|uniref:hypothetical protein n=1 Tax=unclassified Streptomyces TaxID=2593676 RepID=UPI0037F241C8